jgi:hypothetical protein
MILAAVRLTTLQTEAAVVVALVGLAGGLGGLRAFFYQKAGEETMKLLESGNAELRAQLVDHKRLIDECTARDLAKDQRIKTLESLVTGRDTIREEGSKTRKLIGDNHRELLGLIEQRRV